MERDPQNILIESIRRLLRRNAPARLERIIAKTRGEDLAVAFRSLSKHEELQLFQLVTDVEKKGLLLLEADSETLATILEETPLASIAALVEGLPPDDAADFLGRLDEEVSDSLLKVMGDGPEVETLLDFEEGTAGRIMTPDVFVLRQETEAGKAIETLQKGYAETEMPFYIYAVDEHNKLVGVSSLRQLVVVPPSTPIKSFMDTNVVTVETDTDQEKVARLVARYDYLAVPVVDENRHPVGIVTVDDVIDVFRLEATEDMLKMAGAGEAFVETQSVLTSTKRRLPWLFASCMGGIVAFLVIGHYENSLKQVAALAAFIPVIMGMGGNIGTQSSTIVVRGLATGYININDLGRVVMKELAIGLILGCVYGALIGATAQLRYDSLALGASVGLAVLCSMSVSAFIGSLVPMGLARAEIDPAIATGPFVTTAIDIVSVVFYFSLATHLLGLK